MFKLKHIDVKKTEDRKFKGKENIQQKVDDAGCAVEDEKGKKEKVREKKQQKNGKKS